MTGKRVDANHAEIRDGLRDLGYLVDDTSSFGRGFPDLLVGDKCEHFVLLEIKSDGSDLNKRQREFFARWFDYPRYVVRSLDEALAVLQCA